MGLMTKVKQYEIVWFQQVSTLTTKVDIEELDKSRINTKPFRPKSQKSYGTLKKSDLNI